MNDMVNLEELKNRETKLEDLKIYLKEEFIGLDDQIDKIVDNMKIWYLMPEIIDRPIIVNLWGMTGTGKTDLVRKLVNFLGFNRRFVEMQMGSETKLGYERATTTRQLLMASDLEENEPAILLFDEFQRFRRIDDGGNAVKDKEFDDLWMLLSDGKFTSQARGSGSYLEDMIENVEYSIECQKSKEDEKDKAPDYNLSRWEKKQYKYLTKKLNHKDPIRTYQDVLKMLQSIPEDFDVFSGQAFNKSLIFICANLDDAYDMSTSVAEADISADILHKYSLKINLIKIKKSLAKLFKPQ